MIDLKTEDTLIIIRLVVNESDIDLIKIRILVEVVVMVNASVDSLTNPIILEVIAFIFIDWDVNLDNKTILSVIILMEMLSDNNFINPCILMIESVTMKLPVMLLVAKAILTDITFKENESVNDLKSIDVLLNKVFKSNVWLNALENIPRFDDAKLIINELVIDLNGENALVIVDDMVRVVDNDSRDVWILVDIVLIVK